MINKKDPYAVLGVSRDASQQEIKKAYLKIASKHHPDRSKKKESEQIFKDASEAYGIIGDPKRRTEYDKVGHAGDFGQYPFDSSIFSDFGDIGDIFREFFGEKKQRTSHKGRDTQAHIELSLEDIHKGIENYQMSLKTLIKCERCNGFGTKNAQMSPICNNCNGTGRSKSLHSVFVVEQTCNICAGNGRIIRDKCIQCAGEGKIYGTKTIQFTIPPGIAEKGEIPIANEGEPNTIGPNGNLYVIVHSKKHDIFQREHNDLTCDLQIDIATAILGGEADVYTIDQTYKTISLTKGTQNGTVLRIKNQGLAGRGHLYITIQVAIPTKLSIEQENLLRQLKTTLNSHQKQAKPNNILKKVKHFFFKK